MNGKKYNIFILDLTNARNSELLEAMGGYIWVKDATDPSVNIDVQIDNSANDKLNLHKSNGVVARFEKLFISNTAQSGKTITLLITPDFNTFRTIEQVFSIAQDMIIGAPTPTVYNVTCATAGTEYSQGLGECRKFIIKPRTGNLKLCFTSGQSGTTFLTIPAGSSYSEDFIHPTALTLYFQDDVAGAIAEIVKWL